MNILPIFPDLSKKERRDFWLSALFTIIMCIIIYLAICIFG